jgi:serine/threonine-protein kinase
MPDPALGHFLPGTMLASRYRIVGLLGRGGMGEVYRADDLKLGRPVALKFLPRELETDRGRLDRFRNEARVALAVTHPNVCRVYDIGDIDGRHYISMEYIDGEDLASLLRRIGRLPEDKALQIARQLCAGLAAAHEEGILHRDLKPANVMIDGRGRAKITDFGLAGLAEGIVGAEIAAGTPGYMAPEQISGEGVSVRSDVYALGLVFYELFTGKAAFRAETVAKLRKMQSETTPSSPSEHVAALDPIVEQVVLRCLDRRPERRPSSALAVAAALPGGDPLGAVIAAGETPSPELVAEAGKREAMRPALGILLAVAGLVLFVAATRWSATMSKMHFLPLEKRPEVMIDRAQTILDELGYDEPAYSEPVDQAWGFLIWDDVLREVAEADASPERWAELRNRPDAGSFWYRQTTAAFSPLPTGGDPVYTRRLVGSENPPPTRPGDVQVLLDLAGNLRRFQVTPKRFSTREAGEPDWSPLFAFAGLDPRRFEENRPRYQRFHVPDFRRAWIGSRAELPDVEVRVEAGSYEGRPTLFNVATADSYQRMAEDPEPTTKSLEISGPQHQRIAGTASDLPADDRLDPAGNRSPATGPRRSSGRPALGRHHLHAVRCREGAAVSRAVLAKRRGRDLGAGRRWGVLRLSRLGVLRRRGADRSQGLADHVRLLESTVQPSQGGFPGSAHRSVRTDRAALRHHRLPDSRPGALVDLQLATRRTVVARRLRHGSVARASGGPRRADGCGVGGQ